MTTTPALPELPKPHIGLPWRHNAPDGSVHSSAYTADQMRAYALAALQSQPAAHTCVFHAVPLVPGDARSPQTAACVTCGQSPRVSDAGQPAAAGVSDAGAPFGMLRTTCPYCEQGFAFDRPEVDASDELVDQHLDAILRAAGSALRHYTMQKSKDDMRSALRRAILALRPQAAESERLFSPMWFAPLDGTRVLLHLPTTNDGFSVGRWTDGHGAGWLDDEGRFIVHTPHSFISLNHLGKYTLLGKAHAAHHGITAPAGGEKQA